MDVFVMNVAKGGIECLMPTTFSVVDILPDDFPIFEFEGLFSKDFIGLEESIEDEPGNSLATETRPSKLLWNCHTCVLSLLGLYGKKC
jgi:hypothetical protein